MNKRGQVLLLAAMLIIVALFGLMATYNYVRQPAVDPKFDEISKNYDTEAAKVFNSLLSDSDKDMFSGLINFNELFTSYAKSKDPDFGVIYGVDYKIRENDGKVDTDGDGDIDTDDVRKKDIYGQTLDDGESYIQIGNYLSENMVLYDGGTYTQVVGCYDKISAVIEFGAIPISSPVTCLSAELTALEFCNCNVLVPYNNQDKLWLRISGYWYPFKIIPNKPQIMIISKEESQDQVQVYIEEIIQENPGDKEEKFRASCDSYYGNNDGFCYIDPSNTNTMVDYCEDLAVTCTETGLGCKPRCDLFKRGRCEGAGYCKWTVDNICKCEAPVAPTCSTDSDGDGVNDCGGSCGGCPLDPCDPALNGNDCASGSCVTKTTRGVEVHKCE